MPSTSEEGEAGERGALWWGTNEAIAEERRAFEGIHAAAVAVAVVAAVVAAVAAVAAVALVTAAAVAAVVAIGSALGTAASASPP